jgi:hypothetical protein
MLYAAASDRSGCGIDNAVIYAGTLTAQGKLIFG